MHKKSVGEPFVQIQKRRRDMSPVTKAIHTRGGQEE